MLVAHWLRCKSSPQLLILLSPEHAREKSPTVEVEPVYEVVTRIDDRETTSRKVLLKVIVATAMRRTYKRSKI